MKNPFKNYKQALNFLYVETNKRMVLSKLDLGPMDWALLTLLKSRVFKKKFAKRTDGEKK